MINEQKKEGIDATVHMCDDRTNYLDLAISCTDAIRASTSFASEYR